ncbi:hypothetical protein [Streptomyces sp. NPDC001135]
MRAVLPALGWTSPAFQAAEVVARLVANGVRPSLPARPPDHATTRSVHRLRQEAGMREIEVIRPRDP